MQARLKHGNIGNAAFVKKPCIDFKKFIEKAVDHRDLGCHKETTTAAKNFVISMESGQNVCASLETAYATQMRENRKIITSIVKTVIFCASNNIPLRGHSEDKGNFMKLLQFRIDAGDEELKKHFARMASNAKYTSPMFQNEILAIASNMIVQEIVTEANKSFVSLIAGESCDISGKEQLSIVLRYMIGSKVHESFTGFVEMDSVSAESISSSILAHLSKIGVDFQKLVGQGYDGASTMAGHLSGVQKRIRDKCPCAIFVHCASHCLNLVINDQSKVPIIRNTGDVIRETIHFFRESPKRRASLGINIPLFSPTRWSEKYKSIRIFKCNFKRILDALGFLMSNGSSEARAKAFSLKSALEKSGVTYTVCLMVRYSSFIEPLARKLQTVGVSVLSVKSLISSLQNVVSQERTDLNIASKIYEEACEITGVKALTRPRVVEIQAYRDNVSAESTSQYFHRAIYLPYVDGLSCSLRERFRDNPSFFALLSLLPSNKPTQIDEIERSYSLNNLESEVRLWRSSLSPEVKHECLQELFMSTQDYPSVRSAIQIIMALPSTTVEAERSFSCVKRVKTWLRSTMTSDRLSDLCWLHCRSARINDTEKINRVVTCVAGGKRRMDGFLIVVVPYCLLLCVVNICYVSNTNPTPCVSVPPPFARITATDPGNTLTPAQRIAGVRAKRSVSSFRLTTHLDCEEMNRKTWGQHAVIG